MKSGMYFGCEETVDKRSAHVMYPLHTGAVIAGIRILGVEGQAQQPGAQLTWCDRSASRKNTKSPLANRSPCTYAVPRPSLPGRGRSSCVVNSPQSALAEGR